MRIYRPLTKEQKDKISARLIGRKRGPFSEQHKQNLRVSHQGKVGSLASGWRGGTAVCGKYRRVFLPDHQSANKKGYVYEHRLVAERLLGRTLRPKEVVHHWDNDGLNNEKMNLAVLRSEAAHRRLHAFAKRHGLPVLLLKFSTVCA